MKSNSSCSIPWTSVGAAETVIERLLLYLCSSKITRQVTEQKQHTIGGHNDVKLSSQAFKMAVKMAEYTRGKKRRYFASVRENLPTRWKGNSSNPLFRFPDMQRNVS